MAIVEMSAVLAGEGCLAVQNTPAAGTFSRSSVAYKSDGTQVAVDEPRFEPGKFGQAVMVEEGTTNELTADQSYLKGGWTESGTQAAYVDWVFDTINGGATATVNTNITVEGYIEVAWPTTSFNDRDITFSVTAEILAGSIPAGSVGLQIYTNDGTGYWPTATNITGNGRFSVTRHVPASPTDTTRTRINFTNGAPAGLSIKFTFAQVEQKSYATSWQIGGTARSPETLTIPTSGVLSAQEGTIELWAKSDTAFYNTNYQVWRVLTAGKSTWDDKFGLEIMVNYNPFRWRVNCGTGTGWIALYDTVDYVRGRMDALAVTWGSFGVKFYVNGQLVGSNSTVPSFVFEMCKLATNASGGQQLNGLIDDLRISSRARTDAEIAAVYQSGQPLPADRNTTYLARFDGTLASEPLPRSIQLTRSYGATLAGDSGCSAVAALMRALEVAFGGDASLSAMLTPERLMQALMQGGSDLSAFFNLVRSLQTLLASSSSVAGNINLAESLQGILRGDASLTPVLNLVRSLQGTLHGGSNLDSRLITAALVLVLNYLLSVADQLDFNLRGDWQ